MDEVLRNVSSLSCILVIGLAIGARRPRSFSAMWFATGAALIVVHALLVTRVYGLVPSPLNGIEQWNWSGKIAALAGMLTIASMSSFGWTRCGLSPAASPRGATAAWIAALLVCAYYTAAAIYSPEPKGDGQALAFQWTMPGIEEEVFYRGVLLLALNRAFQGRVGILDAPIGWGGVLVSLLFAFDHAITFSNGDPGLKPSTLIGTGLPGLIFLWLRERSGSVALPAFVHNFGNAAPITF